MGFTDFLPPNRFANNDNVPYFISHEDWKLVIMELQMTPKEAQHWTLCKGFFDGEHASRVLPIHQACALRPTREVIEALVKCYPQGMRLCEGTFDRLPLHVACLTNAPYEAVAALISYYPEAVRCKDSIGRLPIHYACAHDVSSDIIELLLRTFPASAGCGDNNGWLPIHVACRRNLPIYIVQLLFDSFPPSADMLTKKGSTPIMCVRKGGDSQRHIDLVEYLERHIQMRSLTQEKSCCSSDVLMSGGMSGIRHRNIHAKGA